MNRGDSSGGFAARVLLPALAAAVVVSCSDAPLIEREARRVALVELFSSTG